MRLAATPRRSRAALLWRLLVLGILPLGTLPATWPSRADGGREDEAPPSLAEIERLTFTAVNAHRVGAGLPPLIPSPEIARIAREHSEAMARGRTALGHDGMQARLAAIARLSTVSAMAENVSRHARNPGEIPDAALGGWRRSARHRKNMEGPYERSGLGAARGPEGAVYLTQIFVAD